MGICGLMIYLGVDPFNMVKQEIKGGIYTDNFQYAIKEVSQIALDVADSHTYSKTYPKIYDCTDFSKELIKQLNKSGYQSKCLFGYYKGKGLHTWVLVNINYDGLFIQLPIESTSGELIGYDDYILNYRKISEGRCV